MNEPAKIYNLWEIYNIIDKKRKGVGTLRDQGLVSVFGVDRAIRELKKRCDNELQEAGRPLEGCSLYVSYLYALTDLNITYEGSSDLSSRSDRNERMRMVGEDEIVDMIEQTWAKHKDLVKLPKGTVLDLFEAFDEIIERKYGDVPIRSSLTDKEVSLSRTLASELGSKKRRSRTPTPPASKEPTPTPPASKEPTPTPPASKEPTPKPLSAAQKKIADTIKREPVVRSTLRKNTEDIGGILRSIE